LLLLLLLLLQLPPLLLLLAAAGGAPVALDAALRPGRLACAGEWSGEGSTMNITEEGDRLLLHLWQGLATLIASPTEVWPCSGQLWENL
jgi:hypothetical protein